MCRAYVPCAPVAGRIVDEALHVAKLKNRQFRRDGWGRLLAGGQRLAGAGAKTNCEVTVASVKNRHGLPRAGPYGLRRRGEPPRPECSTTAFCPRAFAIAGDKPRECPCGRGAP